MERLNLAGDLTYISFISKIALKKGPIPTFDFFEKKNVEEKWDIQNLQLKSFPTVPQI